MAGTVGRYTAWVARKRAQFSDLVYGLQGFKFERLRGRVVVKSRGRRVMRSLSQYAHGNCGIVVAGHVT